MGWISLTRIGVAALAIASAATAPALAEDLRNRGFIDQRGRGQAAAIAQNGQSNAAAINQVGRNNTGQIVQQGSNNAACLVQVGRGLDGAIVQHGDGLDAGVLQTRRGVARFSAERCATEDMASQAYIMSTLRPGGRGRN